VVAFVLDRDLHGRGVGWIDVHLLASAIVERLQLWTADPRFAAVAKELRVAYLIRPTSEGTLSHTALSFPRSACGRCGILPSGGIVQSVPFKNKT
jgi:hypothetical protein